MALTKRDDVVGAFSSKGTNDSFAVSILPRAFWRTDNFLDAECLELLLEDLAKYGITVTMQKTWLFARWESLDHLLSSPFSGWILSDVEMEDLSSVMGHDYEDVENLECQTGNGEEVAGGGNVHVILDECPSCLASTIIVFTFDHVGFNGGLGDVIAKLTQFVSNPW